MANPQLPVKTTLTWPVLLPFGIPSGLNVALEVDAVRDLDDDRSSEITKHAIESGAAISDHVIQNPDSLTLTILSTNTPLFPNTQDDFAYSQVNLPVRQSQFVPRGLFLLSQGVGAVLDLAADLFGAATGAPANTIKVTVLKSDNDVDRINELHSELINVKNKATPITITLNGRTYPDMVLVGVKKTQGKSQFKLGVFLCVFQSLITVEAATIPIPDAQDLLAKRKKVKAAKAKKQLEGAQKDAKDLALNKSLGASLLDFF